MNIRRVEENDALENAKKLLSESEQRFQKMLSVVPDMISIQSPEMDILYSNWQGFAAVPENKQKANTKCYNTYRNFDSICPDCLAKKVLETRKPFRKEVFLATKVGNEPNERGDGWRWNPSKNYILKSVDKSLKRLQTDYIDLYQLHGGTIEDNMEEVVEAFELLKEEGKILHYGLSSIRPNVIRHYAENAHLLTNMLQYNMLDRRPEESALPSLAHAGVGVLVRGALAKGFLLLRNKRISLDIDTESLDLLKDKLMLFSTEKRRLMHLALQWVLRRQEVTSAVVGVRTEEQLEDLLSFVHSPQ